MQPLPFQKPADKTHTTTAWGIFHTDPLRTDTASEPTPAAWHQNVTLISNTQKSVDDQVWPKQQPEIFFSACVVLILKVNYCVKSILYFTLKLLFYEKPNSPKQTLNLFQISNNFRKGIPALTASSLLDLDWVGMQRVKRSLWEKCLKMYNCVRYRMTRYCSVRDWLHYLHVCEVAAAYDAFISSCHFLQISPSLKLSSALPPLPLYDQPPVSPFTSPETSTPPPLPRSPSATLNGEHKPPPHGLSHKGSLPSHSKRTETQQDRMKRLIELILLSFFFLSFVLSVCRSKFWQDCSVSGISSASEIHPRRSPK